MRKTLMAACGLILTVSASNAADDVGGVIDWSGPYIGVHGGFVGADFENSVPAFAGPTGEAGSFIGGAQMGYNWQSDDIVWGGEIDGSLFDIEGSSANGRFQEDFTATARLRLGWSRDFYLAYLTAGIAGTEKEANLAGSSSDSDFVVGFTGGAGVEAMFGDNWSARAEYLYVNAPDDALNSGGTPIVGGSDNHIFRVGLNWHF